MLPPVRLSPAGMLNELLRVSSPVRLAIYSFKSVRVRSYTSRLAAAIGSTQLHYRESSPFPRSSGLRTGNCIRTGRHERAWALTRRSEGVRQLGRMVIGSVDVRFHKQRQNLMLLSNF